MREKKIAFAVITRQLNSISPYLDFLQNAARYGHKIELMIVVYQIDYDTKIVEKLSSYCRIILVKRGYSPFLKQNLTKIGLNRSEIDILLATPFLEDYGTVAYATSRNYALLTAIFNRVDFLLFFDTDVFPKILKQRNGEDYLFEEIDYVGSHLRYILGNENVIVTSSDYTGYYIVPQMDFPHLKELLMGVQKESQYERIVNLDAPVFQKESLINVLTTDKILGGNSLLALCRLEYLPPFFSTTMIMGKECFKGRGEDTLFGPLIQQKGKKCLDIDLKIFHNCFADFPLRPYINKVKNLDRFFYACIGWIIRNPFFNWLHNEYISDNPHVDTEKRYQALLVGSKAAAGYLNDRRFLMLPAAFQKAYEKLDADIDTFYKLLDVWEKMKTNLENGFNQRNSLT